MSCVNVREYKLETSLSFTKTSHYSDIKH